MDNDKWDTADTTTKEKCAEKAELMLQQGPLTLKIIYKFFDQGRQNMSWAEIKKMTSGLGIFEMLGKYTIRNAIISLPDSSFTSDRSRPKLDSENKLERYCWAREFLMFWKSAVTFNEVQILLVHMDVMWFWSTVERRNHEWVPIFGMEPVNQSRSQATSLEKTSVLMSAAFAPVKNDLTKGGLAYLVSLEQLGARARAKQKIYSRVYHDSGSYTYPEVAENVLVERGKRYVKDVGLEEFNFKSFFRNDEFDSVEEIAIRVGSKTGKRVKVRYQMHNSHIDEDLRIFLEKEFEKRDWQLTYPPPDSSICNVIDDCIAPALVNEVKRELVMTNKNNKVLARHELWPVVNKCWHYLPMAVIARAHMRHEYIASALVSWGGGDEFVRDISCNFRNCLVPVCDELGRVIGVEAVSCYDPNENDDMEKSQAELFSTASGKNSDWRVTAYAYD
ncbi:hypothetical protein FisN_2HuN03 [Fistulifera solaris]|uniref:Uncharacterized protein n=1 Tax=Fistulifera solaris TaxID=1519565 RepID=A0A1Z5JG41_FISSO|nr:hypothetical protein FisN_2HuN03 [Fistulifera solaris]|eukprot:GAX12975.1 hypothetical protein FisN_2HuN03 [Fistulifera solaris]